MKRIKYSDYIIALIFIIFGFVLTIQVKNVQEDYSFISLKTMTDLQNSIKKEKEEMTNLRELININENKLKEYKKAMEQEGNIKEILESEIESMKIISGLVDLEGPGIRVILKDGERELYEWEEPENIIIHDGDVLTILNDLKAAGAEAISINGERIMSNSEIQCAGPTITINNYTYGQPFIINAIGDPKTLEAAIKSPDSHAMILKDVYGLIVESQVSERIRIARYKRDIAWKYGIPKEGE